MLPISTWVWNHPGKHGQTTRGHTIKSKKKKKYSSIPTSYLSPTVPQLKMGVSWTSLIHASLVNLSANLTQPRVILNRLFQLKNCLDQIGLGSCLWGTVLITNWYRKASPLWVTPFPEQVALEGTIKLTKHKAVNEAESSFFPGFPLQVSDFPH